MRRLLIALGAIVAFVVVWEGYKAVGNPDGTVLFGVRILPRADDLSMPHLSTVLQRLGRPELTGGRPVWIVVLHACLFTLGITAVGFVAGAVVGLLLAVLMQRFRLVERGLLPYVILSQTVPLVALAPLIAGWSGNLKFGTYPWQDWMTVAVIAAYLAFFPVAVGTLRGLNSPQAAQLGLMYSYAASWWQTLIRLRLPASVGHLVPALRLAAAASVIGTIVAEISTGTRGGIGRLIIEYAQSATGDPARPWTAIVGAAGLGLVVAGLVSLLDLGLHRFHPTRMGSAR